MVATEKGIPGNKNTAWVVEKKGLAWHGIFVNIARYFSTEETVFKDIALKHVPRNIFKYARWVLVKYCDC